MNKLSIKEIKDRLKDVSTLMIRLFNQCSKMSVKAFNHAAQLEASIGTTGSKLRGLQRAFQI